MPCNLHTSRLAFALSLSVPLLAAGCDKHEEKHAMPMPAHGEAPMAGMKPGDPPMVHAPILNRPDPGHEPVWIALGKEPKTVEISLVAAYNDNNGGMNFNGQTKGEATYTVPVGWRVNVTFVNNSAAPHSAMVVDIDQARAIRPEGPLFEDASTPNPVVGTGNPAPQKFSFLADEKHKCAFVCAFPSHAQSGHWIRLDVVDENAKPSYSVGDKVTEAK